jgi:hypothetical protein
VLVFIVVHLCRFWALTFAEHIVHGCGAFGNTGTGLRMMNTKYKKNLDPAYSVISKIGGYRPTARMLGISPSAVFRWTLSANLQGGGGAIPQKHWQSIIDHAKQNKLDISVLDLSRVR